MQHRRLIVNQSEKEILQSVGLVQVAKAVEGGEEVIFSFAQWFSMQELMFAMESCIRRQELDQGDWLRAQEWRAAKAGLHEKIRKAFMGVVNAED